MLIYTVCMWTQTWCCCTSWCSACFQQAQLVMSAGVVSSCSFLKRLFFSLLPPGPELEWVSTFAGRRETFTPEHRPGLTRLILSGLLGNRQGAWSNLLNSASSISLFLFLSLSRLLTFSHHAAVFPIRRYLSHPLKALISHPLSLSAPPPLQSGILSPPPPLRVYVLVCVSLSDLSQRVLSGCAAVPPPHLSHQSVSSSLRQARASVGYWACTHTHTHRR